ncbi:unnamed protein product [marine sediment metagenome]|uniref:Uncharacterized protein n=1 Tax=marine sediment metagenome TaxID=412755 RepID=X1CV52_9ZZZZ
MTMGILGSAAGFLSTGLGSFLVMKGLGLLLDFVFNTVAGFSVSALAASLGFTIASGVIGYVAKRAKKRSTKKKKSTASHAKSSKAMPKAARLCKMFSAGVEKLKKLGSKRTKKQDAAYKAAKAGKKKYCPA